MRRAVVAGLLGIAVAVALAWFALDEPDAPAPGAPRVAEFVRGNGPEPESLDPHLAQAEPALNVLRDLYEGLTTMDGEGRVIPGVAGLVIFNLAALAMLLMSM